MDDEQKSIRDEIFEKRRHLKYPPTSLDAIAYDEFCAGFDSAAALAAMRITKLETELKAAKTLDAILSDNGQIIALENKVEFYKSQFEAKCLRNGENVIAVEKLEKEKASLVAEVARLHEKYDMQFLVKNNDALKARVDELESITEFACLTGDCDHSTQPECNLAAFRLLNDLKKQRCSP
jgi:hypothetical protein